MTPTKIRELSVVGSHGTFIANYLTQDLTFYENNSMPKMWPTLAVMSGMSEGNATRFSFQRREPLRVELKAFIAYASGGPCPVSPADAAETLNVALELLDSAREDIPVRHSWAVGSPALAS